LTEKYFSLEAFQNALHNTNHIEIQNGVQNNTS